MLPLSHLKSSFHVSGNHQTVSHPVAPGNLCRSLPRSHGALAAQFSGVTSYCWMRLLGWSAIFVPLVAQRDHWGKREAFLSVGDSQRPHYMADRLRVGSSTSQEPLSDSPLATFSETGRFWPSKRPGSNTNWKTPALKKKKWPLNGTLAFSKSRERTQNFLMFSPSWPSVRILVWGTHASCLSVASLPPVPLCLFLSDFLDNLYSTFHIQMIYRKRFWGSLWSRSFSDIQKSEGSKTPLCLSLSWGGNQVSPTPEHAKVFPSNYSCFSEWGRTKLPLLLQIPKLFRFFWKNKDLTSHQRDNSRFLSADLPWYQSQFEHYLVYNLGIKLWLQKGKMTFWHREAMTFFRLQRKLVKMKFFSWKLQNQFFLQMQWRTTSLLKALPREKLEVNPFHVLEIQQPTFLKPQLWANQNFNQKKKKKGRVVSKRHFQSQAENYEIYVCLSEFMYVSVCAFLFFFYNIAEIVNEF